MDEALQVYRDNQSAAEVLKCLDPLMPGSSPPVDIVVQLLKLALKCSDARSSGRPKLSRRAVDGPAGNVRTVVGWLSDIEDALHSA